MAEQTDMTSAQDVPHFALCQECLKWYLQLKFSFGTVALSGFSLCNVPCIVSLCHFGIPDNELLFGLLCYSISAMATGNYET